MREQKIKLGIIFATVYTILVIAALIFAYIMVTYYTEKSEFAGLYIGLLTLPWSLALFKSFDLAGVRFATNINILILIFFAILNAFLLYKIGKKIEKNW